MHVYASLAEFKDYLQQNGSTVRAVQPADDAVMLATLESVSRRVDEFCGRGTGFGPVTATRRYDGDGSAELWLDADLASATPTVTIASATGATGASATVDTDYFLRRGDGSYGDPPYRRLLLHGAGSFSTFAVGYRTVSIASTWGYPVVTRTLTPTVGEALDASETTVDVSALTGISPGMTLLLDSEQVYVSATTDATPDTLTVDRGRNGTTAAEHLTGIAITRYVYDAAVVDAVKRVTLRRWRARDAGADGFDGGGQVGVIAPREGEDLILARTVGHLRIERAG
jgi:hypothetical protein